MLERKQPSLIQKPVPALLSSMGMGRASLEMDGIVPSFQLNLNQGSIASQAASPTFTRATTATFSDWENVIRTADSGEVRFQGLRRVKNLAPNTSFVLGDIDSTPTGWTERGIMTGRRKVENGFSFMRVSCGDGTPAIASSDDVRCTITTVVDHKYVISVKARSISGADARSSFASGGSLNVTLSAGTEFKRYVLTTATATGTSHSLFFGALNANTSFDIAEVLVEDVTGQSNQNPSEYVSVGVLSAPYHGANVDGVKYFPKQNGNVVNNNIVEEAEGPSFPPTAPFGGYLAEASRTNLVKQSEDFGTTWTVVQTPTRTAAAIRCGDVVLDLIEDDTAVNPEGYTQAVTFTGDAVKSFSIFLKEGTSTTATFIIRDNTASVEKMRILVQWVSGIPEATVTTGTLEELQELGNGVYRLKAQTTSVTAANSHTVEVYAGNTGGTGTVYMGGVQVEDATFCSSYIKTTTATASRNADILSYSPTGWFNENHGTMVTHSNVYTDKAVTSSLFPTFWSFNDESIDNYHHVFWTNDNQVFVNIATNSVAQITNTQFTSIPLTNKVKHAYTFNSTDATHTVNGAVVKTDSSITLPTGLTVFEVGCEIAVKQPYGVLSYFAFYPQRLSNATLQRLTR